MHDVSQKNMVSNLNKFNLLLQTMYDALEITGKSKSQNDTNTASQLLYT